MLVKEETGMNNNLSVEIYSLRGKRNRLRKFYGENVQLQNPPIGLFYLQIILFSYKL